MKADRSPTGQPKSVEFEDRRRLGFGGSATPQLYRFHPRFGTAAFPTATAGAPSAQAISLETLRECPETNATSQEAAGLRGRVEVESKGRQW